MEASKTPSKRTTKAKSEKDEEKPKQETDLGERPYAGEESDWKDERENAPGTADHLGGESPYAGGF